ncbi:MAG: M1 family aminopeptidase [Bacteroidales bacterium]
MKKILSILLFLVLHNILFAQFAHPFVSERKMNVQKQFASNSNLKQSSLMNKYDVKFYKLDIKVERTSTYIEGNATINAKVIAASLDTFVFELKNYFTIDSIKVNNQLKAFNRNGDEVFVGLTPLSMGASISVQIFYYGLTPTGTGFFTGISCQTSATWGNQVTSTLSEPFAAKEWFPVKQSLTDKADSAYIFVTTSNDNRVGSQGKLTAVVPLPNNKVRYEWKTRYPIDYYLISIAVSDYADYSIYAHPAGLQDSILVQNYVYSNPLCLPNYKTEIDRTPGFIELYSSLFGLYPFYKEKYGHCMAPIGGGMEHQTMTTLSDFNFYLTSHELCHQWWGDNVTCKTWSDIWINEGFASYGEYLAAAGLTSYQEAQQHMVDAHNNVMSMPDGSVYIPPLQAISEGRIFDGRLSYKKGAAIIHNLRFEIGNDALFFNLLKTIQIRFKDSTITGLDVKAVAEELSGQNFTDFFNQWYFGEGFPTLDIVYWQQNDTLSMNVHQTTSASITPLFKMKMEYKIQRAVGDTIIKLYHSAINETFKIPMNKSVSGVVVDPNNWVLNGVGSVSGISEHLAVNFLIYPNPCNEYLEIYIGSKTENYQIAIYDITGKKIFVEQSYKEEHLKINIQNLEKGIYLVELKNELQKSVQKFIKN